MNEPKSISGSSSQMLNLVRIWSSGQVRTPEMFQMNNHRNNITIMDKIQINAMQYGKILNRPKITQFMHHRFFRSENYEQIQRCNAERAIRFRYPYRIFLLIRQNHQHN